MVSKIEGTGSIPSPDRAIEVAKNLQQAIHTFMKQCETVNPDNSLHDLATSIVQLAALGKAAQIC